MSTNTTPRTTATVTINSVTNFNQELATYNATVSWGGASTTVTFEWSRDDSSWDATTSKAGTAVGSPVTTNSASVYFNATGFLSDGLPYYVRAKAVNAAGTVYSSSTSFTPWTLKTQGPSNTNGSRTIDTVTPTGGSAQPVYIYQIAVVGGGGGSGYAGGGGGGALNSYESALVTDGSRIVSWTIGGGGAAALELSKLVLEEQHLYQELTQQFLLLEEQERKKVRQVALEREMEAHLETQMQEETEGTI